MVKIYSATLPGWVDTTRGVWDGTEWVGLAPPAPTAPDAPTGLAAARADDDAKLSWTAPASNGGSPISGYTVQYRLTSAEGWTTHPHSGTATTTTVWDLPPGSYAFRVAAVNAVGTGPWSNGANLLIPSPVAGSDAFTAADGALNGTSTDNTLGGDLSLTWTAHASLSRIGGQVGPAATGSFKLARVPTGEFNGYVEFVYATAHGATVYVIARAVDNSNHYRLGVSTNGTLTLEAVDNSSGSLVTTNLWSSAAGAAGVGDRIGLGCFGDQITVWVDGKALQTVTSTIIPTSGTRWGFAFNSGFTDGRVDAFRVGREVLDPVMALASAPLPATQFPVTARADNLGYVHAGRSPWVGVLDTTWLGPSRMTVAEWTTYCQTRRSQGYTGVAVCLVDFERTRAQQGTGYRPFPGSGDAADLTQPNPDYFADVRTKLLVARDNGLVVVCVPAWFGFRGANWRANWASAADDFTKAQSYGTYLGRTFGDLDHIIWMLGGDNNPDLANDAAANSNVKVDLTNVVTATADAITAAASVPQLYTYHSQRNSAARAFFPNQGWLDLNAAYASENVPQRTTAEWSRGDRPVILTEGYYEARQLVGASTPHPTRVQTRGVWWQGITTGALASVNGNELVWSVRGLYGSRVWSDPEGIGSEVSQDMGVLSRVLNSFPGKHWVADASDPLVLTNRGSNLTLASGLRSQDGTRALVYFPSSRSFTLDSGFVSGIWVNPQTAATVDLSSTAGTIATPEGWDDAALMLTDGSPQ